MGATSVRIGAPAAAESGDAAAGAADGEEVADGAADAVVLGACPGGFAAPAEPAVIIHTPSNAKAEFIVVNRGTTAS